jgi:hypothetical protein
VAFHNYVEAVLLNAALALHGPRFVYLPHHLADCSPLGLAAAVLFAAIIGPPRNYWYMARFPEWGSYAPGIAPVLAVSATFALMIVLGHGVMRLISGPANADPLARRPWEPKAD